MCKELSKIKGKTPKFLLKKNEQKTWADNSHKNNKNNFLKYEVCTTLYMVRKRQIKAWWDTMSFTYQSTKN